MSRENSRGAPEELIREVADAVREYGSANETFDAVASVRLGVNRTDMQVLDLVDRQGPVTAGSIAEGTHLTTGAVTAVIDRLEKKGFVRRRSDKGDRRKVWVEVTPRLKKLTQEIYGPLAQAGFRNLSRFSTRELQLIRDVLVSGRDLLVEHSERIRR
ncbi:MAG: MarR family winged helix-turn-helix transcriptional regulator [Actinomycetota bacterium]